MKAKTKKGKKGRVGKDGKTKQQRYVERNRAKVNAANNKRNKEVRKKQQPQLVEDSPPNDVNFKAPTSDEEEGVEAYSNDSNFDIASALSLPRSDGPLPCSDPPSPIVESDDDLAPFERLSNRFVGWSNLVDKTMESFGLYWTARQGWKPKQPFTLTRYESRFYLYCLQAKEILYTARMLLRSLTPGTTEWEESLDMIQYLSALDSFMDTIRDSWKEKPAANGDENVDM